MKPIAFRYGIYAGLAILVLGALHVFVFMPPTISWEMAEVAGYLTMILSMIFVFMGIRYYRDHVNNGFLTFGQGLKLGALIVLVPAVTFGLFDILYTEVLHPSWADEYFGYQIEKIKASSPPDQVEQKLSTLQKRQGNVWQPGLSIFTDGCHCLYNRPDCHHYFCIDLAPPQAGNKLINQTTT